MTAHRYRTLSDLLSLRASELGDRALYVFVDSVGGRETLTYQGLQDKARSLAASLKMSGLKPGERVLLMYPAGLSFIEALFGCFFLGLIAVPVSLPKPRRPLDRLLRLSSSCAPSAVLTDRATGSSLRRILAASEQLAALPILETDALTSAHESGEVGGSIDAETLAMLQYTSGSTGVQKGVMLSHQNILSNQALIQKGFAHPDGSTVVGWLPTFHDMGLIGNLLQSLYIGGRCVLMSPTSFLQQPIRWLQMISDERAYTSGGPNFAYDLCVAKKRAGLQLDLSGWRVAFCGSELVRADTLQRFSNAFREFGFNADAIYPCYGLAEATLIVTGGVSGTPAAVSAWAEESLNEGVAVPQSGGLPLVSCGAALGEQELRIVDSSTGEACGERVVGEICVAGTSIAVGYWSNEENTAEAFQHHHDGFRYLHTGDRGFIHAGNLYVLGRNQEVMNVFGRKLWANLIEVAAEQAARELGGGRCGAYIVSTGYLPELRIACECDRRALADRALIENRVKAAISTQFDLTATVLTVPAGTLPRTSSGKLRRDALPSMMSTADGEPQHPIVSSVQCGAAVPDL
jgi:acyl-CoA synthetase (AMP-forming)/AMP-acid ligase II